MTLQSDFSAKITKVKTALENVFVKKTDITTSFSSTTSDSKVASEKLVKDSLDAKASSRHPHSISDVTSLQTSLDDKIEESDLLDLIYPKGSIYMSVNDTDPSVLFGGTWEQIAQGRTIIGQGTGTDSNSVSKTFTNGATGGEYNHTLTTSEMPKHKHQTGSRQTYGSGSAGGLTTYGSTASTQNKNTSETGSGNAHNNIQPYLVCYIWKRTA